MLETSQRIVNRSVNMRSGHRSDISASMGRILVAFRLKLFTSGMIKLSKDPHFVDEVRELVACT
jgi:hypothetical protein